MWDLIAKILSLIPAWIIPPENASSEWIRAHRIRVAIASCLALVWSLALTMTIMLLLGFFPNLQFDSLARKSDVSSSLSQSNSTVVTLSQKFDDYHKETIRQVSELAANSLAAQLVQLKINECLAKGAARVQDDIFIANMMRRYKQLTGDDYPLSTCKEL